MQTHSGVTCLNCNSAECSLVVRDWYYVCLKCSHQRVSDQYDS